MRHTDGMQEIWIAKFIAIHLLLASTPYGAGGVQITDLRVPPAVRNGSSGTLLDCEYSLRPEELDADSGLVVKWFFNNEPAPVYQWIPGQKPQELGVLQGRLNLEYRASEHRATMHRALYIVNPTTELSGDYKCFVSTFKDEDFMTKKMVVFAPGRDLEVYGSQIGEALNITCRAQGLFPEPKLAIYKDSNLKDKLEEVSVHTTIRNGVFDITATKLLDQDDLSSPTILDCDLRIPEANYVVRKSYVYYKGRNPPMNDYGPSSVISLQPSTLAVLFSSLVTRLLIVC